MEGAWRVSVRACRKNPVGSFPTDYFFFLHSFLIWISHESTAMAWRLDYSWKTAGPLFASYFLHISFQSPPAFQTMSNKWVVAQLRERIDLAAETKNKQTARNKRAPISQEFKTKRKGKKKRLWFEKHKTVMKHFKCEISENRNSSKIEIRRQKK